MNVGIMESEREACKMNLISGLGSGVYERVIVGV